jgi:hypothetical protein
VCGGESIGTAASAAPFLFQGNSGFRFFDSGVNGDAG